jgi:AGCS family alanine or glycine:cation symporter
MLLAVGLYFTIRTKFVQIRSLAESIRVVSEKGTDKHAISAFEALMVSTASRVGTGNIVGVASAICIGGYGSVFWMLLIALIGGSTAFIESTLAQIYKKRDKNGGSFGGPAYYIQTALKSRKLGVVFAVTLIATYAGGFNMLASYNVISTLEEYDFYNPNVTPYLGGLLLAVIVGFCIMGGGKRLVKITGVVVPVMGILYILLAVIVMVLNYRLLPQVWQQIFRDAFDFKAMFGAFAGSAMLQGIKRGLFSNEAGVGSAPNAAAAADVSHPAKQGLVQMLSVFIDTMLICMATAMMCLCSGVVPDVSIAGAAYVQQALSTVFGAAGPFFISIAMLLFAFTTLLGNFFYSEGCLKYIVQQKINNTILRLFQVAAAVIIFIGALLDFSLAWSIADILMGLMAIINLPVIVILGKTAIKALDDYNKQKRSGNNPVFKAKSIGIKEKLDFWQ